MFVCLLRFIIPISIQMKVRNRGSQISKCGDKGVAVLSNEVLANASVEHMVAKLKY
jgi:hypothetical protein